MGRHLSLRKLAPAGAVVLLLTLVPLAAAAPTPGADVATVAEDAPSTEIPVLDNDTGVPPLTITAVSEPGGGSAQIVDGPPDKVSYLPDPDFNGPDLFTYTVEDDDGPPGATANVNVTVTPVNDAPVAVDDALTLQEDVWLGGFNPSSNDSKGPLDESSQTLTVTAVSQASHGSASLNAGLVSYVPAENYVGQDSFTYTVCDGTPGLCDDGTVTITLTPVNDAPRASLDSYTVTAAGATFDVRENDSPGPVNDGPQTLAAPTIHTPPQTGTATANPDGTITYVPAPTVTGLDYFFYFVCDNEGACERGQVNLEVLPQIGVGDATGVEGDSGTTTATFNVSLNAGYTKDVTVGYTTTSGSAVSGSDYQAASGTLTFAPGEASKSVVVNVVGDLGVEADEAFFLDLSSPVNASIGDARGAATIRNDDSTGCDITGTPGADRLTGTPDSETICGLGGNDTIAGGGGDDLVAGGPGNDSIDGGAGGDTLTGESGNDRIAGGAGDDAIDGDAGNDTLSGDDGGDAIEGGDGKDRASGGAGSDTIDAGAGNDVARGGPGSDTLDGLPGNDKLYGEADDDRLEGGPGSDRVSGDHGNDWVNGAAGDDSGRGAGIFGGPGNDTLRGEGGHDLLSPGTGDDDVQGDGGTDHVVYVQSAGGVSVDLTRKVATGAGRDRVKTVENVTGSRFADTLLGNSLANRLSGGAGNDRISGRSGNDTLLGGAGRDVLDGAAGVDTCAVGPGGVSSRRC